MEYRNYYGEPYSLLGYGTMRFTKTASGAVVFDKTKPLIDQAIAGGVNCFDCAYAYSGTEEFLGKALTEYPRASYHLATKIHTRHFNKADDIKRVIETQLKRLNTDYIDNYLLHGVKCEHWNDFQQKDLFYVFDDYRRQGVIKHFGFSFHDTPELLKDIVASYHWDFAQVQINYLDWQLQKAKEQYEVLRDAGLPIFVMEPLRGGVLAVQTETETLYKPADLALRFIAQLPGIVTILSGMITNEQLDENIKNLSAPTPLSDVEMDLINEMRNKRLRSGAIPCSVCLYCEVCPKHLDIPSAFAAWNAYKNETEISNGRVKRKGFTNQIGYISRQLDVL